MHYLKTLAVTVGTLAVAAAFAVSASGSANSGKVVKIGQSSLGRILVDSHGKTLYLWAHDKGRQSTCYGDCAEYWPPLLTSGRPMAGAGAQARLLGTTRRHDGRMQVTYAGHPLYYFVQDTKPGQTKGEGLTGFGGRWDPLSAAGRAVRKQTMSSATTYAYAARPLKASIISPAPGAKAGVGGTFSVDVSLQARTRGANSLLSGYKAAFNDPNAPTFHPGPDAAAPGLVVLLSTTPTIAGTPLQGPKTNLAGVFQINDVSKVSGLKSTFNSWIVSVPGFFGKGVSAQLTVFAVSGTAPALITGNERPISNVVRERFTIAN
jgi:predicted lipoprotein with Yx(FWY)xxD motif